MRSGGFCESDGPLPPKPFETLPERGQGALGQAFLTGVPTFSDKAASEPGTSAHRHIGTSAAAAGLSSVVAVRIVRDGKLAAAVAWYF